MKRLRARVEQLEKASPAKAWQGHHHLCPRPEQLGAVLNILCDAQRLDRVQGCQQVLGMSTWARRLPETLPAAIQEGFAAYVAAGGAKDFTAYFATNPSWEVA